METNPAEADALFRLAQTQEDQGEEGEALGSLTRALEIRPDFPAALEMRGRLYLQDDQPEQAFADLSRAIRLAPNSAPARALRGEANRLMGLPDDAVKDFTEAIRLDPNGRFAYVSRAAIYMARRDYPRAVADYTQALRIRPTQFVYNRRAACHYFSKNYAQAIADHTAAYNMDPEDHGTCNYLAWILCTCPVESLRNGRRAVELAKRACEKVEYKSSGYLDTLAAAYAECGQFEEAVQQGQRVVDIVEPDERAEYEARLALYRARKPYHTA